MVNILDCSPKPELPFREGQTQSLRWTEQHVQDADVLVRVEPTAHGKSLTNTTTSNYFGCLGETSAILVPNKMLQDQYQKDFQRFPLLKGMSSYECYEIGMGGTCRDYKKQFGKVCNGCECNYMRARLAAEMANSAIFNYYSYVSSEIHKNNLIVDEAHNLLSFLADQYALQVWRPDLEFPDNIDIKKPEAVADLIAGFGGMIQGKIALMKSRGSKFHSYLQKLEDEVERLDRMAKVLREFFEDFIVERGEGEYHGENKAFEDKIEPYIYIKPLKISRLGASMLWPSAIKRIIFSSATIGPIDIRRLGLDSRRVAYHYGDSPIPPRNRPVIFWPLGSMSTKHRATTIPKIVDGVIQLANKTHPDEKGLIHATYEVAKALRERLGSNRRFLFHTKMDKQERYQQFLASTENTILVGSGMSEGIDLAYDAAGWQVCTQFMWPFLGDPVNKWLSINERETYQAEAIRTFIQQTGRVCRTPTDKGITYVLNSDAWNIYQKTSLERDLYWPRWFCDAVAKW